MRFGLIAHIKVLGVFEWWSVSGSDDCYNLLWVVINWDFVLGWLKPVALSLNVWGIPALNSEIGGLMSECTGGFGLDLLNPMALCQNVRGIRTRTTETFSLVSDCIADSDSHDRNL